MKNENSKKIKNPNELTITYKIDDYIDFKIKLFGRKFVENNKGKCKIILDNRIIEISEYLYISENLKNKN